jgi:hypothetical protein
MHHGRTPATFLRIRSWTTTALGAQPIYFLRGHPEPTKDLGIVLTEFGRDIAHPHALADLLGADVWYLALFRVSRML